jgi:membrane-associated protease RseP (regulator of RpoE activity)
LSGPFSDPAHPYGSPIANPVAAAPIEPPHRPEQEPRRRVLLPIVLFLATCYTTYRVGGFIYAGPMLFILLCHEFGHYLQARRYHVPASLPYFIPMPAGPLGTMGAVIAMSGRFGNRRSLYDIGITGPLAGLVPTLILAVVGLQMSTLGPIPTDGGTVLGEPLLFKALSHWIWGELPANQDIMLHPLAYAGWVGILITSVNLFPIGQLDGGHVLYALLREKAHFVATLVLGLALVAVVWTHSMQWSLMLLLLILMGPKHPPTANDHVPLGTGRIILGWLTLLFPIIGFTPTPFGGM